MKRRRRSRKKKGLSAPGSMPRVCQSTEECSLGAALDEIGFRPLGKRILVSTQLPATKRQVDSGHPVVGRPANDGLNVAEEPRALRDDD